MKTIVWVIFLIILSGEKLFAQPVSVCIGDGNEWAPYTYWERVNGEIDKSKLTGAATILIEEAFKIIGKEYTIQYMPWARVQKELAQFANHGLCEVT